MNRGPSSSHPRLLACLAALVAVPAPAAASTLFRVDFETGDLSGFSEFVGKPNASISDEAARAGRYAGKVTLAGKEGRGEMVSGFLQKNIVGSETFIAFSFMTPAESPVHQGGMLFFEAYGVPLGLGWKGPALELSVSGGAKKPLGAPARGAWHDVVLHVRWSPDPLVGLVEVTIDGETVLAPWTTATLLPTQTGVSFHLGLSNWPSHPDQSTEILFVDEVRAATTLDEVRLTSARPVVAPRPSADAGATGVPDADVSRAPDASDVAPSPRDSGASVAEPTKPSTPPRSDAAASSSPPPDDAPAPNRSSRVSGGCDVAGASNTPGALSVLLGVAIVCLVSRRRRRQSGDPRSDADQRTALAR